MDSVVTSLLAYRVALAVILSKVLPEFVLRALAGLLQVKSLPVLKASPRSLHHFSLTKP